MVTDLNDFNGAAQTTNLGGRSSNLFWARHFAGIWNKTANPAWMSFAARHDRD